MMPCTAPIRPIPCVNKLIGYFFDTLGANGYMWRITHNVTDHTYTNIQGIDEDLEVSPLVRLCAQSEHEPVHRYQHFYAWFYYGFSTLFLVLDQRLQVFSPA